MQEAEQKYKWGWADEKGNIIIPCIYDIFIGDFTGNALVLAKFKQKWGAINKNGDTIIPFIFANCEPSFLNERFLIFYYDNLKIKYSLSGKIINKFKYIFIKYIFEKA